jgi:hypothetical protein
MMKSALLFYQKIVADLKTVRFTINPYDPCVTNKMVNGHQMTICWHVDDLLVGHKSSTVVTETLDWFKDRYETPDKPLAATRGKVHDQLGMNINFSQPGSISFDMIPYIMKVSKSFLRRLREWHHLPLQITSSRSELLLKPVSSQNNRPLPSITQLLKSCFYLKSVSIYKRLWHSSLDEDDWGKLKRVLKYLNGTRRLKLTLSAKSLSILQWYVDASHQTHDNC